MGWGEFCIPFVFTAVIAPSSVQLLNPPPSAFVPSKSITFSWTKSPDAVRYWIEIAADTEFFDSRISEDQIKATSYSLNDAFNTIHRDTMYYWHVAAIKSDIAMSPFSETRWFKITNQTNGVDDEPILINNIAPNPSSGIVFVSFTPSGFGATSFSLYNERGDLVHSFSMKDFVSGMNVLSVDFSKSELSSLSSGAYFLKMSTGDKTTVRQLVIVK